MEIFQSDKTRHWKGGGGMSESIYLSDKPDPIIQIKYFCHLSLEKLL